MNTISISTSSKNCSVTFFDENNLVISKSDIVSNNSHSIILADQIYSMLKDNNLDISSFGNFVIDIGPGSFTGIRIGLATIKGLSQLETSKIYGVSSLDGYFYNFFKNLDATDFSLDNAFVLSCIISKNDIFYKLYKVQNKENILSFSIIKKENFISLDNLKDIFENIDGIDSCSNIFVIGENVDKLDSNSFAFLKTNCSFPYCCLTSTSIGQFALENIDKVSQNPVPLYLKKPQAQIELEKKLHG